MSDGATDQGNPGADSQPPAEAWLETADGKIYALETNCSMGRSPSNRIVLEDRRVSRRHAVVHRQDETDYVLVDLGSANGSFVNGKRVSLPLRLNDGDQVAVGDQTLTFRQVASEGGAAQSVAPASMTVVEVKSVKCWLLIADIIGSTKLASQYEPAVWASTVGAWSGECRRVIDLHGGTINKYLGDGFLALWSTKPPPTEHFASSLKELVSLQDDAKLPFRLVAHLGEISLGGAQGHGEENLSGFELVLLFRMEKMAGSLGLDFMCSEEAYDALREHLPLESAGDHVVEGFVDNKPRSFFKLSTA